MKNKLHSFLFGTFLFAKTTAMACTSSSVLSQIPITFTYHHHSHYLGLYRINLKPTLTAIRYHNAQPGYPFYEKNWWGKCPGAMDDDGRCIEFTVYPDDFNFSPVGIMKKIEKYTLHHNPNRGEVRVITNANMTKYVYTTNHEKKFCGPYRIPLGI